MSRQSDWRKFVERRRAEVHDVYSCASPTHHRCCPKHDIAIPQAKRIPEAWVELSDGSWRHIDKQTLQLSGICQLCRDGLYEQFAAEYIAAEERQKGEAA